MCVRDGLLIVYMMKKELGRMNSVTFYLLTKSAIIFPDRIEKTGI